MEPVAITHQNPAFQALLHDFPRVAGLFDFHPYRRDDYQSRRAYIEKAWEVDRRRLCDLLGEYNLSLGASPRSMTLIDRLCRPGALTVITGQQAGVLTGPMYTIHKALSALQLARRLEAETGWTVVPLFWVAAEDHDFQEIDHIQVVGRDHRLQRLSLDRQPPGRVSIGHVPVGPEVWDLLRKLDDSLAPSEFKGSVLAVAEKAAGESSSLADWFARLMAWLFRDEGLVLVNPLDPGLKEMAAGLFGRFFERMDEVNQALRAGEERLGAAGLKSTLSQEPDAVHLFYYHDGERCALEEVDGRFRVRAKPEISWSRGEAAELARRDPNSFSANVVLRPLVQEYLFPNLAYLAGPGETAYYAQYRDVYGVFGLKMPVIYPRASVTLVEGPCAGYLEKYGVGLAGVIDDIQARLDEFLASCDEVGIEEVFSRVKEEFTGIHQEAVRKVSSIDPTLEDLGETNLARIIREVEWLEARAKRHHRQHCEVAVRQFKKLGVNLAPRGSLQERVLNIMPFLFRHGPGLISGLAGLPLLEDRNHKAVFL